MKSVWTDTSQLTHFPMLQSEIHTDVLVIGGGITGLICAHQLKNAGVDCMVAEAKTIASGITKNTTAKITSQHGLIYQKLLKRFGPEPTKQYWQANQEALNALRRMCSEIDCDFSEQDSFIYSQNDLPALEAEMAALDAIGCPAALVQGLPLPFPTVGAVKFLHQAQFHPLKFLAGICKNLTIYENTPVRELKKGEATTDAGRIHADAIIVATHFPSVSYTHLRAHET